jgi:hypothetical protein
VRFGGERPESIAIGPVACVISRVTRERVSVAIDFAAVKAVFAKQEENVSADCVILIMFFGVMMRGRTPTPRDCRYRFE